MAQRRYTGQTKITDTIDRPRVGQWLCLTRVQSFQFSVLIPVSDVSSVPAYKEEISPF
jgi:hypothetical protein